MSKKALRRKRRRQKYFLCAACGAMALLAVTLCVLIMTTPKRDAVAPVGNNYALALEPTVVPPVPTAEPTVEPTAVPTPEPTIEPTQAPDESFAAIHPEEEIEAEATFEYLPVIHHADTTEKRIAITVDDCFQMDNLKTIAKLAIDRGGRLTLFPIGQNVVRDGMSDILKACVFNYGFEIENHTWSHSRIFRMSEEDMAAEIWKQRAAVNQALGVNYQEHFFRLMGGDGEYDQRTHNYLRQLGYLGIADWSLSGSDADLERIKSSLAPGKIYLFHTTDADTAKLKEFIPYAVSQGYELVTLNELLGLEANAVSDLSTAETTMPEPQPYATVYAEQKKGDYSWSVVLIQRALYEKGYLAASAKTATKGDVADGVYGDSTADAISAFQRANGLPETGVADAATQRLLLGDAA